MAKGKRRAAPDPAEDWAGLFVRGFLSAGMLSAFQDRLDPDEPQADGRKVLRHAIQGGAALSAATLAVRALAARRYGVALGAATLGAATVVAAEQALRPRSPAPLITEETPRGEEA